MKKGGGNKKGIPFERKICKELSLWWTQDEPEPRDDVFYRTASSGGRATQRQKNKQNTAFSNADVGLLDPLGEPFLKTCVIEIKRGYNLDLLNFVDGNSENLLFQFWTKISEEADSLGRHPLLIFKRDRKNTGIIFTSSLEFHIKQDSGDFIKKQIRIRRGKDENGENIVLNIISFSDFLSWARPITFKVIQEGVKIKEEYLK